MFKLANPITLGLLQPAYNYGYNIVTV